MLLEKGELIGVGRPGDPPVGAGVDSVHQRGMARLEQVQRLRARPRKLLLLPDLVEPPRVAVVSLDEILAPDAQPPCDPDVDRVGFRQGPAPSRLGRMFKSESHSAERTLDETIRSVLKHTETKMHIMCAS